MTYYHATFRKHLPSILKLGLRAGAAPSNWPDIPPGVYLSSSPLDCILIMIEQYTAFGDPASSPVAHLKEIIVLVIDDGRLDLRKLQADPNVSHSRVFLYDGVIDVTNQPVLSVENIIPIDVSAPDVASLTLPEKVKDLYPSD